MLIFSSSSSSSDLMPMVTDESFVSLEDYVGKYAGIAKCCRLEFIATHCPPLASDALRLLSAELKESQNVKFYTKVFRDQPDSGLRRELDSNDGGER